MNVTNSGAVLIPLTASMIVVSIVVGRLITRTGRYKGFMLVGLLVMMAGYFLLTRLGYGSTQTDLTLDMIVVGLGLGAVLQTYTLVVQNATSREDLGVATSTTQLSRSLGATVGTAVFGTIMTNGMRTEIPKHLPPQALNSPQAEKLSGSGGVGAVLDPNTLGQLPDAIVTGIREGLAAAMPPVFVAGLPMIAIAFVATLFIKELPLRTKAFVDETVGGPEGPVAHGADARKGDLSRSERLIMNGLTLEYLARRIENANGDSPKLISAASALAPMRMNGGTEGERARLAAREVIRPLALQTLLAATGRAPGNKAEALTSVKITARNANYRPQGGK